MLDEEDENVDLQAIADKEAERKLQEAAAEDEMSDEEIQRQLE